MKFRRFVRPLLTVVFGLAALGALSGCATFVDAQVTSFHQLADPWQGRRIAIEPREAQRDSLEWKAYAEQVRQAMLGKGFVDAAGGPADYTVRIDYRIDGRSHAVAYPAYGYGYGAYGPVWGLDMYYPGRIGFGWRAYYPLNYGVVGTTTATYRSWSRELKVEMTRAGETAKVFEGTAVSEGEIDSLTTIMPVLVRALFDDFPGVNGRTRRLRVELSPDQSSRSQ